MGQADLGFMVEHGRGGTRSVKTARKAAGLLDTWARKRIFEPAQVLLWRWALCLTQEEVEEGEEGEEERRRPSAGAGLRVEHSEAGGTHAASGVGSALMSWLGSGSGLRLGQG